MSVEAFTVFLHLDVCFSIERLQICMQIFLSVNILREANSIQIFLYSLVFL